MIKEIAPALLIIGLLSCQITPEKPGEKPEPQISFALENKSHNYYVKQAELWWKVIEQDSTLEEGWFNYYRACRNARGTADWSEDFVNESPYLRFGYDIVNLMETAIPNSFTLNFVKGSTGAVDPTYGPFLLKAYEMNPDFPGIQAAMVTYSVSTHNPTLRKEVNKKWKNLNTLNPGLIQYSKNVLAGVEPNAIVLTQHDNDSYPVWQLQDAYEMKPDVTVLNIDFLLLPSYREKVFPELGLPPFEMGMPNVNDYRTNWKNVVQHILENYNGERPLYLGLSVSPEWYKGFENRLQLNGLTYRIGDTDSTNIAENMQLFEVSWRLEDLNKNHEGYHANSNVAAMNKAYLKPLGELYTHYTMTKNADKANEVKALAMGIIERTQDSVLIEEVTDTFSN